MSSGSGFLKSLRSVDLKVVALQRPKRMRVKPNCFIECFEAPTKLKHQAAKETGML